MALPKRGRKSTFATNDVDDVEIGTPKEYYPRYRFFLFIGVGEQVPVMGVESFSGEKLGVERAWRVPGKDGHPPRLIDLLMGQARDFGKHLDVLIAPPERAASDSRSDNVLCFTVHWERLEWMPIYLNANDDANDDGAAVERVMLHGVWYDESEERTDELLAVLRLERRK